MTYQSSFHRRHPSPELVMMIVSDKTMSQEGWTLDLIMITPTLGLMGDLAPGDITHMICQRGLLPDYQVTVFTQLSMAVPNTVVPPYVSNNKN